MSSGTKNGLLGVVAVALLVYAGYRIFFVGAEPFQPPRTKSGFGVCLHCKQDTTFKVDAREQAPYVCQGCGERAVYPWMYCLQCNHRFVPDLERTGSGPPRIGTFLSCPVCGCYEMMAFNPADDSITPAGDAPLPKWP